MLHKLARKASMSLVSSGADDVVKKLRRVFQLSRGPWSTSKFGKELEVARMQILRILKEGTMDQSLLESWLPGVARDQQCDPSSFGPSELIRLLEKKSGPWMSKVFSSLMFSFEMLPVARNKWPRVWCVYNPLRKPARPLRRPQ